MPVQAAIAGSTALLLAVAACGCDGGCTAEPPSDDDEAPQHSSDTAERQAVSDDRDAEAADAAPPRADASQPRVTLALGGRHSCVLVDGEVWCWGSNEFGQLGDESLDRGPRALRSRAAKVPQIDTAVAIAAGAWHTCVIDGQGVACWGHGGFGQLGSGAPADRAAPRQVKGLGDVVEIGAGAGHTCARGAAGELWCWGRNDHGQLGDGALAPRAEAQRVEGLGPVVMLAVGRLHTCALRRDGEMRCWGLAVDGQLGDGARGDARGDRRSPTPVRLEHAPDAIAAGAAHTCTLRAGHVRCWGSDDSGQLGGGRGGDAHAVALEPQPMEMIEGATALALGGRHSCALRDDGHVLCAGFNGHGQLGDGSKTLRPRAVAVGVLPSARAIAAGAHHSCAWTEGGTIRCWGRNHHGQLGDGSTESRSSPVDVLGLPRLEAP